MRLVPIGNVPMRGKGPAPVLSILLVIKSLVCGAPGAGYCIRADRRFLGYAGIDKNKRFSDALDIQRTVLYAFGDKYVAGIIYMQYLIAQSEFNIGVKFGEILGADKVYPLIERVNMRGTAEYIGRRDVRKSMDRADSLISIGRARHHGFVIDVY